MRKLVHTPILVYYQVHEARRPSQRLLVESLFKELPIRLFGHHGMAPTVRRAEAPRSS